MISKEKFLWADKTVGPATLKQKESKDILSKRIDKKEP